MLTKIVIILLTFWILLVYIAIRIKSIQKEIDLTWEVKKMNIREFTSKTDRYRHWKEKKDIG